MKRILSFSILVMLLSSCGKNILAPKPNTDLTTDDLWVNAAYGGGLLGEAYQNLNYNYDIYMDNYTDNSVPASPGTNSIVLGSWTLEGNPIGDWNVSYNSIKYLNIFLQHAKDLPYQIGSPMQDSLKRNNRIGEAYFLRGWYEWLLLRDYAGYVDGETSCMGFPIVTDVLTTDSTINRARNTYEQCVTQIVKDLDSAIRRLPDEYKGSDNITGISNRGRGSGLASMALKALVCLYAASPAYGSSDQPLWKRAAQTAYDAIDVSGGLTDLKPYDNFNDYTSYDYIWIQPPYSGNGLEQQYYPPSLYGSGDINPSQNLVDAFPARDGYPADQSPVYDKNAPYENRDPRLDRFIFYNEDVYDGTTIETYKGGADAPGGLTKQGTRTGYYMKKFLSTAVSLMPGSATSDTKFKVFLDKTRLYLNFAEAANEAYGPEDASLGFSAYDVLKKIRKRAGIDSDPNTPGYQDSYLDEQASMGKEAFRALIHNERRIELCFDGDRFWDMRRWNDPLNHTLKGAAIARNSNTYSYQYVEVEKHTFSDYMRYIPLPYNETLIMSDLKQNKGWK